MLPKFIIIGAMKGGTTSLYHYLASHPATQGSSKKETDFFKTPEDFARGIDWYQQFWRNDAEFAFEASPNYTKRHVFPGVPERMHSVLPDIKLIYLLRDPIKRIVSHYTHNCAKRRESRPLAEVLKEPNNHYLLSSKYYFQLQAFLDHYSPDQILVLQSEALQKRTAEVVRQVLDFLELPDECPQSILEKRFHSSQGQGISSAAELWLKDRVTNRHLRTAISLFGLPFQRAIKKPVLTPADLEQVQTELNPDLEKLREFTGDDFADWSV